MRKSAMIRLAVGGCRLRRDDGHREIIVVEGVRLRKSLALGK
jgi:hypothetical protein